MPEHHVFGAWAAAAAAKADAALTDIEEKAGRILAVLGGHRNFEVQEHCKPDGIVSLKAVAISGFRTVRVPGSGTTPSVAKREGLAR
jgi:hypothetical protein